MAVHFDQIDKAILRQLQKDGNITNVALAEKVGLTPPPCLRRVQALEKEGYIAGYHAEIDPAVLGLTVMVLARVKLTANNEASRKAFEVFARRSTRIAECYAISGNDDYLIKIYARSWEDYQSFHSRELLQAPNVAKVRSTVVDVVKQEFGPPV